MHMLCEQMTDAITPAWLLLNLQPRPNAPKPAGQAARKERTTRGQVPPNARRITGRITAGEMIKSKPESNPAEVTIAVPEQNRVVQNSVVKNTTGQNGTGQNGKQPHDNSLGTGTGHSPKGMGEINQTVSELSLSHLPPDEQHAIAHALDGDLAAFNELVIKYQRMAYSVAYRMLQREDVAEDAVQDSFIKAYRALESFRGGQFKSWLMRIVVNTCYDVLRVQKRYISESLEEEPTEDGPATHLVDHHESPHEYVERMELGARIELGMQNLPEDQRLVLMLCDVHGYAYDEIAEITDQPMGTVKSRINRARARLREFLLQQPELLPSTLRPKNT